MRRQSSSADSLLTACPTRPARRSCDGKPGSADRDLFFALPATPSCHREWRRQPGLSRQIFLRVELPATPCSPIALCDGKQGSALYTATYFLLPATPSPPSQRRRLARLSRQRLTSCCLPHLARQSQRRRLARLSRQRLVPATPCSPVAKATASRAQQTL
jgi:hypothetical protein